MFRFLPVAALALPALAQAGGPLQVVSQVLVGARSRAADGTTRVALVPARRVVPGDRVTFVLAYRNTGAQPVANVAFDNPVPAGLAYRAPAAGTPAPDVSVDGRTFAALPALRVGARAATVDDVRHVRWRLDRPIPAGASGKLAFQAVLR
ncbi:hypothetical protein ASG29_15260 [Sphingomonas sp. Leaf412]|uniref:DUF11 domain-containing protein n=1 Tax=Sphingomonas sp. Leaf412 TaxID=1736370 RepID=UPI0006F27BBB|nr:DUF11 domain-containing protein [Sphingomonas sp. Leaf412]KQT31316.1 hypothetical protein ASG29_15260 [Sphingomonas sp. Leaf412]